MSESAIHALWPTLFAVAGILLAVREAVRVRKTPEFSSASRLFLLLAASLFAVAGFADLIARHFTIGKW